jgi:hypothetical protein
VVCECNSPKLFAVFDVDGCLVNTEQHVRRAYLEAGVIMPPGAWGQPWTDWLPAAASAVGKPVQEVRQTKSRIYQRLLETEPVELLPPWVVWRRMRNLGITTKLLTGAGLPALRQLLRHTSGTMSDVLGWELTTDRRAAVLNSLPRPTRIVLYVDDLDLVASGLRPQVNLVKYSGQTEEELWTEIVSLWTPSSLLPAEARG